MPTSRIDAPFLCHLKESAAPCHGSWHSGSLRGHQHPTETLSIIKMILQAAVSELAELRHKDVKCWLVFVSILDFYFRGIVFPSALLA